MLFFFTVSLIFYFMLFYTKQSAFLDMFNSKFNDEQVLTIDSMKNISLLFYFTGLSISLFRFITIDVILLLKHKALLYDHKNTITNISFFLVGMIIAKYDIFVSSIFFSMLLVILFLKNLRLASNQQIENVANSKVDIRKLINTEYKIMFIELNTFYAHTIVNNIHVSFKEKGIFFHTKIDIANDSVVPTSFSLNQIAIIQNAFSKNIYELNEDEFKLAEAIII